MKNFSKFIILFDRAATTQVAFDPDAQLFIDAELAAGVVLTKNQANAINQLVLDLKSANIWSKMKSIYPFISNGATAQKFNLKDPRDLDAAFRLVFNGGGSHTSNGYQPNGVNGYANTFLIPSTSLTSSNNHLSIYNRTNTIGNFVDMGSYSAGSPFFYCLFYSRASSDSFLLANGSNTFPSVANTNSEGMYIISKLSAANTSAYKNNTKIINAAASGTGISTQQIFIGAANNGGTAGNFSNREIAFSSIGDGLTDAEALAYYNAVQTYQTTLGRQV
jgi:hypothetical protein